MKKIFSIFILLVTLNNSQEYKSMRSNSSIIESIYLTIYSDDLTYVADKPFNIIGIYFKTDIRLP